MSEKIEDIRKGTYEFVRLRRKKNFTHNLLWKFFTLARHWGVIKAKCSEHVIAKCTANLWFQYEEATLLVRKTSFDESISCWFEIYCIPTTSLYFSLKDSYLPPHSLHSSFGKMMNWFDQPSKSCTSWVFFFSVWVKMRFREMCGEWRNKTSTSRQKWEWEWRRSEKINHCPQIN
jgi:hypothetical protein